MSDTPASEMMAKATPEQMQAGMEDWNSWSAKAGNAVVDLGSPAGDAASVGSSAPAGDVSVTGYSILQGESLDEITRLLDEHPHLKTPGVAYITAIELLSMPGA